ncbi:MAG: nuclear transport factor 2 family protein [Actinomycetota bacterium]
MATKENMMDANKPELVSRMLEAHLNEADVEGLEGLYETGAIFADYEGTAKGWPDIKAAHQGFLDEGLSLVLNDSVVFQADDIALVHWSWTVTQADGTTIDGTSAEVLRRQADGTWKFVIDNSDGSALIGSPNE